MCQSPQRSTTSDTCLHVGNPQLPGLDRRPRVERTDHENSMTNPTLLLLDEPSEGLAPLIVLEIGKIVAQVKERGLSILLVEQNLNLALSVADRVYVMSKGRIVFEGVPADLRAQEEVMQRYLGV